jgi:hypothetical protein
MCTARIKIDQALIDAVGVGQANRCPRAGHRYFGRGDSPQEYQRHSRRRAATTTSEVRV